VSGYISSRYSRSKECNSGQNVCTYFLLDSCKFGAAKCIYSHSKEALPKSGWWTTPEQIAKVKEMMAVAEQKNREQRQLEAERWKAYLKTVKGAGRPPKSAGIKGGNKKAEGSSVEAEKTTKENAENVPTDVAADAGADTKTEDDKENKNKQRRTRKPQPVRRKKSTAPVPPSAKPADEALPTADSSIPATTAAFTDYQLNTPSGDVNPVCVLAMSSLLDMY
jgi:hypothetical protein